MPINNQVNSLVLGEKYSGANLLIWATIGPPREFVEPYRSIDVWHMAIPAPAVTRYQSTLSRQRLHRLSENPSAEPRLPASARAG
jgi:hypothetical protein